MTTCAELARIFERVQGRLEKGAASFNAVVALLTRRAEVEAKFAQLLKDIIPERYEKTDVILSALVDELSSEFNAHLALAQDLRMKVVIPAQTQASTFREKQKGIVSIAKKDVSTIQKTLKDIETAAHDLEAQKAKLPTIPPNKTDAQHQKIQKAAVDLQRKRQAEVTVATTIQARSIPIVHGDFSELDAQRISKTQSAAVTFEILKKDTNLLLNQGIEAFQTTMADYDGKKRAGKFVGRIFDTSATPLTETDQDSGAVAIADFRSLDPHDLSFERGDRIQVLVQHESGWWEGICNEQRGLFPSTFVVQPGDIDPSSDQIAAVFLAISDFASVRGSEISLLCGDLVYVDFVVKGRCTGTNLRTGVRGFFPIDVLEQRLKTETNGT
jgi:hypothetical protein